jgi:hypothetical protein
VFTVDLEQRMNIRQVAHEPLEPPSGSRTVRKWVAPPLKYDVNGCEWLVGATRLLFLLMAAKALLFQRTFISLSFLNPPNYKDS